MQHLIVFVIFALCVCWVLRRIVRFVSRAKKSNSHCDTCTDTTCPLRQAASKSPKCTHHKCNCG